MLLDIVNKYLQIYLNPQCVNIFTDIMGHFWTLGTARLL